MSSPKPVVPAGGDGKPFANRGRAVDGHDSIAVDRGDLVLDPLLLRVQMFQSRIGISRRADDQIVQRFDDPLQPRFRAHEAQVAVHRIADELDGSFGVRCQLVASLALVSRHESIQPPRLASGPVGEIRFWPIDECFIAGFT